LNNNKITVQCGLSNGLLGNAFKSGKGLNSDSIEKILYRYPDLNSDWLLTGRGTMILSDVKEDPSSSYPTATPSSHLEGIPLIPFGAMAGAMSGEVSVMDYECEHYVVPIFKGADFLIPVKGSSMYPKYSSGDIVACKRVPMTGLFFQWGKVYVLDTDQGAIIKRIKPTENPDQVLIVSDNPSYDPFILPISSIHSVALVIGVIRLE